MARLVLTVIGEDQSGLVDALSGVVRDHDGNWDTSHMAHVANKFAGIVIVTLPDSQVESLIHNLKPLKAQGLLEVDVQSAAEDVQSAPARRLALKISGLDHPGIVHDLAHQLATRQVSIEVLRTETTDAPMIGGILFLADAVVSVPGEVEISELGLLFDELADRLTVDIEFFETT